MPFLYVAKNTKYSSVSRNKPNVQDWWIIKEFIELECSEETHSSNFVFIDRKHKKAYSNETDIPIEYSFHRDCKIYSVTPDDDYYDPAMEYSST